MNDDQLAMSIKPPPCDYCFEGIPVVCGDCGQPCAAEMGHFLSVAQWLDSGTTGRFDHPVYPVHRIPDPEGIEGTAVVPCVKGTP